MRLVLTALHGPLGLDFDTTEPLFTELPDISTKIEPFGMTIPVQSLSLSLIYIESLADENAQFIFIRDHASAVTSCKLYDNAGILIFDGAIDADEDIEFDYADKSVTFEFIGHVAAKFAEKIPDDAPAIEAYGFHYGINIYKNVIADFWRQYELPGELHFPVDAVDYYVQWARMRPLEAVCGLYGEERFKYEFNFAGLTIADALKRISTYGFCRILWRAEKVYFIPVSPTETPITLDADHIIKSENWRNYRLDYQTGNIQIFSMHDNIEREPFEAQCDAMLEHFYKPFEGLAREYHGETFAANMTIGDTIAIEGVNALVTAINYDYSITPALKHFTALNLPYNTPLPFDESYDEDWDVVVYPNPSNSHNSITIMVSIPSTRTVQVRIYSVSGQLVKSLYSGTLLPGHHHIPWNGGTNDYTDAGSGIYTAKLTAASVTRTFRFTRV